MIELISIEEIGNRLKVIFPEGIPDRNYFIRDLAAHTIFVFLYIDAIEGNSIWLAPKHITRMSDKQSNLVDGISRLSYELSCIKPGYKPIETPWYKENTRESIRDETINGLKDLGVVKIKADVPTTSSKGRYALSKSFSQLFSPLATSKDIALWQKEFLSESHLAKIRIMSRLEQKDEISIDLPSGTIKKMKPGPSSTITKEVIESFASIHLKQPAVIWISESGNKVIQEDSKLMERIGLPIDQKSILPDIVLADLGRSKLLLIFIEVVATDGPFDQYRKDAILTMCSKAGFAKNQALFISAFKDRNSGPLKRRFSAIAADSLIWCVSEPDTLIWIGRDQEKPFEI